MDSLWLIPLLPGVAAVVNLLMAGQGQPSRAWSPRVAGGVAIGALLGSIALSVRAVAALQRLPVGATERVDVIGDWIPKLPVATRDAIGILEVPWGLRLDPMSAVALFSVLLLILGMHLYAIRAARDSRAPDVWRFAHLGGSATFLVLVVLGSSLPGLLAGWSGIVTLSALLVRRWDDRDGPALPMASLFGLAGFTLAVGPAFVTFGSLDLGAVNRAAATMAAELGAWGAADTITSLIALSVVTVAALGFADAQARQRSHPAGADAEQTKAWADAWLLAGASLGVLWQVRSLVARAPLAIGVAMALSGLVVFSMARRSRRRVVSA